MNLSIMRRWLIAVAAAALIAVPVAAQTSRDDVDLAAIPADKEALQEIDTWQKRELRKAANRCRVPGGFDTFGRRHHRNICVLASLDRIVRETEDPAKIAFHFALPPVQRYDEQRSYVDIERILGTGDG